MTSPEGVRMPVRRFEILKPLPHKAVRRLRRFRRVFARVCVYLLDQAKTIKNTYTREKVSGTSGASGLLTLTRVSNFCTSGLASGHLRTDVFLGGLV